MSLVYRSFKLDFRCTCCCLTLQWNNSQISSSSHPLPRNVFVPINVWFPLQNDRKILVVCRLFVTSKFNPIRFDFFSWCGESPWVSILMPARNIFLSFQNPIIKCRALFAWVMVPNDFPYWKEKNYDGKNAWRSETEDGIFSFKQLSEAWGWQRQRSATCFSCTWEVTVLIVSHFSCFLKWREQRWCTAQHE